MLFKRKSKEKEKEVQTQDVFVHKFILFNSDVVVAIDSIKAVTRDKNKIEIIYKSNAKITSTILSYEKEESAKETMRQLGYKLNLETIVL